MKKQVKILETSYNEEDGVVIWKVLLADGKQITLVNKAEDLIRNLLGKPNLEVTRGMILLFNKELVGKTKFMDFIGISNSIKDIDKEKIDEFKSCLDEFPLEEAAKLAQEKK